jgi:hypothetical protein
MYRVGVAEMNPLCGTIWFLFVMTGSLFAAIPANVAINKPYTLSPAPNYTLCTDAEDGVQLTDGIKKGSYWGSKSTVGWKRTPEPPEVTIDLQKKCRIKNIVVYSAAGTRGSVAFYDSIYVLISLDGFSYRLASYYPIEENVKKASLQQKMISPELNIRINGIGRFVKLIFIHDGSFVFLDELEIYGSFSEQKDQEEYNRFPIEIREKYSFNAAGHIRKRQELLRAIESAGLKYAAIKKIKDSSLFKKFEAFHDRLKKVELIEIQDTDISEWSKEFSGLKAEIYHGYYDCPVVILPADPGSALRQNEIIISGLPSQELETEIYLWQNEYEAIAFNIINCTANPLNINTFVSPLMSVDGRKLEAHDVFEVRYGYFTYGWNIGYNADALMLQDSKVSVVEPGGIIQVWVTVHSRKLKAGKYDAAVQFMIEPGLLSSVRPIPVHIEVASLSLPTRLSVFTYNWAFPELSKTTQNCLPDTSEDLRRHYINTQMISRKSIPFPSKSQLLSGKRLLGSTRAMDDWLELNQDARMVLLFLGFKSDRKDSGYFGQWMTPAWNHNFKKWLSELAEHLKSKGFGYDRFALYPFDEYIGDDFYDMTSVVRQADPRIKIFANSFGKGPSDFTRLRDRVDIWCLPRSVIEQQADWFKEIKGFGRPVWAYYASKRASDPAAEYRNIFWWAFKNELTGLGFWVYCDTGPWTWDDFAKPKGDYSIIYGRYNAPIDTQECIIPSRRWELWRLGVQDYQRLFILKDRIDKLSKLDISKASEFKNKLDNLVDNVFPQQVLLDRNQTQKEITEWIIQIDNILKIKDL